MYTIHQIEPSTFLVTANGWENPMFALSDISKDLDRKISKPDESVLVKFDLSFLEGFEKNSYSSMIFKDHKFQRNTYKNE